MDTFIDGAIRQIINVLATEMTCHVKNAKNPGQNTHVNFEMMKKELSVLFNNLHILGWKVSNSILFDPSTLCALVSQRFSSIEGISSHIQKLPVSNKTLDSYAASSRELQVAMSQNPGRALVIFNQVKAINGEISRHIPSLGRLEKHIYINPAKVPAIANEILKMCNQSRTESSARVEASCAAEPAASKNAEPEVDALPPPPEPEEPPPKPKAVKRPVPAGQPAVRKRQKTPAVFAKEDK